MLSDRFAMNSPAAQESILSSPTISPPSRATVFFKCALGLFLMIMGGAGAAGLWTAYERAAETRKWTPTDCVIVASQLLTERESPHSPVTYRADVRYRYHFGGAAHSGNRVRRTDGARTDRRAVLKTVAAFPTGTTSTCFVDPLHPEMAILEHATLAPLYSLWFPLLFVVGGAGMVTSALRRPRP